MVTTVQGLGVAAALLGAGAALVPASPANAHYPTVTGPAGVGSAQVAHDGGTHRYVSVCTWGADDMQGWFWLQNGQLFVGNNPQTDVCYAWDVQSPVSYFYACDHKGCGPPTFI
jgi:hypothetical protein